QLIITEDGSHSIHVPEWQVSYHSRHGAITESMHVFIKSGLQYILQSTRTDCLRILEMGFGTGLNALLTMMETDRLEQSVYYETLEIFPIDEQMVKELNYCDLLRDSPCEKNFIALHQCDWNKAIEVTSHFTLRKCNTSLPDYSTNQKFDLIYFDAFAPD